MDFLQNVEYVMKNIDHSNYKKKNDLTICQKLKQLKKQIDNYRNCSIHTILYELWGYLVGCYAFCCVENRINHPFISGFSNLLKQKKIGKFHDKIADLLTSLEDIPAASTRSVWTKSQLKGLTNAAKLAVTADPKRDRYNIINKYFASNSGIPTEQKQNVYSCLIALLTNLEKINDSRGKTFKDITTVLWKVGQAEILQQKTN